jgi:hypothetical protein
MLLLPLLLPLLHACPSLFVSVCSFGIMMWELFTGQEAFGKLLYGQFLRPLSSTTCDR